MSAIISAASAHRATTRCGTQFVNRIVAHIARVRYGHGALDVATALGYRSHGGVVAVLQRYESGRQRLARIARRIEQELTNA